MILSTLDKMGKNGFVSSMIQPVIKNVVRGLLRSSGEYILEKRTVGDILVGRSVDFFHRISGYVDFAKSLGLDLGIDMEQAKTIGYFTTTNNSVVGPMTIRTGIRSFGAFAQDYSNHHSDNIFFSFFVRPEDNILYDSKSLSPVDRRFLEAYSKGTKGLRYYEQGDFGRCNLRRGTDGSAFGLYTLKDQRPLWLDMPLCRSFKMLFVNFTKEEPILANYAFDRNSFNYGGEYWCYCPDTRAQRIKWRARPQPGKSGRSGFVDRVRRRFSRARETPWEDEKETDSKPNLDSRKCDGVYDFSQCQKTASVFISFPYFSNAPGLASYIDGWNDFGKDRNHTTYHENEPEFSIHQELGVPFKVRVKLQVNVKVTPSMIKSGPRRSMYLPLLWFEQRFDLSPKIKNEVQYLHYAMAAFNWFAFLIIIIGFIMIVIGVATFIRPDNFQKLKKQEIKGFVNNKMDMAQKTQNKIKVMIAENRGKLNKTDHGSSSSLTQIIPRVNTSDSDINGRHKEYSLRHKLVDRRLKKTTESAKSCKVASRIPTRNSTKIETCNFKTHYPNDKHISSLTPLE